MSIKYDREAQEFVTAPLTDEQAAVLNDFINANFKAIDQKLQPLGVSLTYVTVPEWTRGVAKDED
jgi:hypothetical protein